MNVRSTAILGLLAFASSARAITVSQVFRGEATPPSVVNAWNYGADTFTFPNGNLAMCFCSEWNWGQCTGMNGQEFHGDVVRLSERLSGVWQDATNNVIIEPSSVGNAGQCPWPPPLGLGTSNDQDRMFTCDPSVAFFNGVYYLFYTAPRSTDLSGTTNAIFLATSSDGRTYAKHHNASGTVVPVIDYTYNPTYPAAYGTGQSAVIVDTLHTGAQGLVMYYTVNGGDCSNSSVRRAESTDGVNWTNDRKVWDYCRDDGFGSASVAVRKINIGGSVIYFMVYDRSNWYSYWTFSLDGVHFQKPLSTHPIDCGGYYCHNPGLSDVSGMNVSAIYGSMASLTGAPELWRLRYTNLTLGTESLYGNLDNVMPYYEVRGWAYDPDRGTNDAAVSGDPTYTLNQGSLVRVFATNTSNGQQLRTPWYAAEECRPDLVSAGVAPDCYHGFHIPLLPTLTAGTWNLRVEGKEFPDNGTVTTISGAGTVTIPTLTPRRFYTLTPCRILDTRNPNGPLGGPALAPWSSRTFQASGTCGIPGTATALAANQTIVGPGALGSLVAYPGYLASPPYASTTFFLPGVTRATELLLRLSPDGTGTFAVYNQSSSTTHLLLDVSGYFQ